jgi:hypothetical protein
MNPDFDTIVFTEGEFSIRVGTWSYFITHDPCNGRKQEGGRRMGVAYDRTPSGRLLSENRCETCKKPYSEEMDGFMQMLVWEK